jgi:hypothetical protein
MKRSAQYKDIKFSPQYQSPLKYGKDEILESEFSKCTSQNKVSMRIILWYL